MAIVESLLLSMEHRSFLVISSILLVVAGVSVVLGTNSVLSTMTPTPSEMQVTDVPKTATIKLQMNSFNRTAIDSAKLDGGIWVPARSVQGSIHSEFVDVSQYRHLSVLMGFYNSTQQPSTVDDAEAMLAQEIMVALVLNDVYVTFFDPGTGASRSIEYDFKTAAIPVAGPQAFVTLAPRYQDQPSNSTGQQYLQDLDVVMHLSS